jgi:hypothetical protein
LVKRGTKTKLDVINTDDQKKVNLVLDRVFKLKRGKGLLRKVNHVRTAQSNKDGFLGMGRSF